ncbi:MAG TPA: SCP2 sterol-binding domain-containing protein [Candidatus Competibacter sp.]|nr:sterol-binding protein [Candidatus Competibacteraceae bacterium]HRC71313.1 SCP2 sterol-binding domain-containing protein [Candidatus Competibacter sp.]
MTPAVITTGLEAALNRYLALDPESLSRLASLEGKVIAVELVGLGQCFYMLADAGRIRVTSHHEGEPAVWIRGTPLALFRQWRGVAGEGRDLIVEGDTAVAAQLRALLARLDIDWEEQLARRAGDAVAHQLGNLWRGLQGWKRRTSAVLARDGAEYLQQELRALPPPYAVERFLGAVDALREDADRLAARVERLRRHVAGDPL